MLQRPEHHKDAEFSRRLESWLQRELPGFLTRDVDRALFADLLNASDGSPAVPVDSTALQKAASADRQVMRLSGHEAGSAN